MNQQVKAPGLVRFAGFEFDCRTLDLRRDGTSLKLQPQPSKVLAVLIRHAGQVVSRQQLAQEVWGSDTFVDYEHGLNYAIRQIRATFGDDADAPQFLETLPKKGYRFIAPIVEDETKTDGALEIDPANQTVAVERPARSARIAWVIAGIVLIGLTTLFVRWNRLRRSLPSKHAIQSVAVLPLSNDSGDAGQDYFADGMTDELITEVAKIRGLRVISHTSVQRYKNTQLSLPAIARELGVDGIIEGTVMRSGDRVRITTQFIDARADKHLWADSYERDLRNVLQMQSEVARAVAGEVHAALAPHEQEPLWSRNPVNTQAHDAYLKGLLHASKLTPEGLRRGIQYFDEAIRADSQYAPAYAGKAEAYGWAAGFNILPPREVLPKAREAATKALELDDSLSQAHHSLAWVRYAQDWDFEAADEEFKRAIELNPNDVTARLWYGMFLAERGRTDEALQEMEAARKLDPLSLIVRALSATPLLTSRQYDGAVAQTEKALAIDPSNPVANWMLFSAFERKGDLSKAIDQTKQMSIAFGVSPDDAEKQVSPLRKVYEKGGPLAYWRARVQALRNSADPYPEAVALAHIGDDEQALQALTNSSLNHSTEFLFWVQGEPAFDRLREDHRFQALLQRMDTHKP